MANGFAPAMPNIDFLAQGDTQESIQLAWMNRMNNIIRYTLLFIIFFSYTIKFYLLEIYNAFIFISNGSILFILLIDVEPLVPITESHLESLDSRLDAVLSQPNVYPR